MCTVSNMGDAYKRDFYDRWPNLVQTTTSLPPVNLGVPQEDFDALKAEVEELKLLLLAAKRFDDNTGQPECQMDEKVEFIKTLADMLGVDMEEVFGK